MLRLCLLFFCRNLDDLVLDSIFGFVLNIPSNFRLLNMLPMPVRTKHWIALRKVTWGTAKGEEEYFNFDSNLKRPERIGPVSEPKDKKRD